ncbi:hypothetical protein [Neotamlana laminarinivorans]|uniref:Uncharacterized protein n=1 Tax=Neotamlana laminarinivorans TaxID=2883124 RepID=A0A9X1L2E2_9FLAO|nr:hypothetical protein [Tamlana laminarinivorans]MCB4797474.1 hypothetical protein [Tamlana laminarinivorans]
MKITKVLIGLLIVCYVCFTFYEVLGNYDLSIIFDNLLVPIITIGYFFALKKKSLWVSLFLIFYSVSDLLAICFNVVLNNYSLNTNLVLSYDYYLANLLYDLAHIFLIFEIAKYLSLKFVLKNLKLHLIVLVLLNIYLAYVIQMVSESNYTFPFENILELTYNVIVLSLLSIALLSYLYQDNRKSLFLFLGALCIVFSEIMDIAFIYVKEVSLIHILGTSFTVLAFLLVYKQSYFTNSSRGYNLIRR